MIRGSQHRSLCRTMLRDAASRCRLPELCVLLAIWSLSISSETIASLLRKCAHAPPCPATFSFVVDRRRCHVCVFLSGMLSPQYIGPSLVGPERSGCLVSQ